MCKLLFSKDSVQWAYCIFHQKLNVYKDSSDPGQRDEIENVVASYAMSMNSELYRYISKGKPSFLMEHDGFEGDLAQAVEELNKLM